MVLILCLLVLTVLLLAIVPRVFTNQSVVLMVLHTSHLAGQDVQEHLISWYNYFYANNNVVANSVKR